MRAQLDHLVVVAHSLEQGVVWCEDTLGITPGPGGVHALFGTHNRLFKIATAQFPGAYFEIIAINSEAACAYPIKSKRWFDMDNSALRKQVREAPRLVHFVASVPDVHAACDALARLHIDRGAPRKASRSTPHGVLEWQITVRDDGQRLFNGVLPTLIQWGGESVSAAQAAHPTHHMQEAKVQLLGLKLTHPEHCALQNAYAAIGLNGIPVSAGAAAVCATLRCPKGVVELHSNGI